MTSRLLRLITYLSLCLGSSLPASLLTWDRTEVELEMTPEQKEISAAFRVTNAGDATVRISRIKTSCGCTGSVVDRKILEPGESTDITATFNKGRRQGLNQNRLEVFIDGQRDPVAMLRMSVNIPRLIDPVPQIVFWSATNAKTARTVTVTLDKRYLRQIDALEYNRERLDVTVEPDPADTAKQVLEILPKSFDFLQRETITIRASGPDGRQAEAMIQTLVQP